MNAQPLKVAIVGTGLAGLSAANRLARGGVDIELTLFEKSSRAGGRASTTVKDGYHLNLGAHALYKGGAAMAYLHALDIKPAGAAPVQTNAQILVGDKLHALPIDAASAISTGMLSVGEKLEWATIMSGLGKIDSDKLNSTTVADWLEQLTKSERIKKLLLAFVRLGTYANSPEDMSAGAAIRQLLLGLEGVLYLDNGWQTIIDSLRAKLPGGVTEHLNCSVDKLTVGTDGRIALSTTAGDFDFDHVILAVPPQQVHRLMPDTLPQSFVDTLVPARIACFDVCLSTLPQKQNSFALGLDCPLYYSVHSNAAKLTPDKDAALVHMGYYLAPGEAAGEHALEAITALLDKLQPGWRDHLVYKRYLPEMVATFGMPLAALNGANGLPDVYLDKVQNARVLACGDWVGDWALIADGAVASGIKAGDAILHAVTKSLATPAI